MRSRTFWLNILVVGFMLIPLYFSEAQAGADALPIQYEFRMMRANIASLHGIQSIRLWFILPDSVECVSRQDSATIGYAIEHDLKSAGISLLMPSEAIALEDSSGGRLPLLTVSADFFEDENGWLCVYSIDVFFEQACLIPTNYRMMATTWHTSTFGWASCDQLPVKLGEAVGGCISRLVEDYLFANQEGYLEKRKAVEKKFFGPSDK